MRMQLSLMLERSETKQEDDRLKRDGGGQRGEVGTKRGDGASVSASAPSRLSEHQTN